MQDFIFDPPLSEGIIVRRKSQFTMTVLFGGEELAFHCPTTGRIGNIDVTGRPCLVSLAQGTGRKTAGTVEAAARETGHQTRREAGWLVGGTRGAAVLR